MNRDILYMPILKAKRGEFSAYNNLEQENKDNIIPIFETKESFSLKDIETLKDHIGKYCLKNKISFDLKDNILFFKELLRVKSDMIPTIELEKFKELEKDVLKSEKNISSLILRIKFPLSEESVLNKLKEIYEEYTNIYDIYLLFDLGDIGEKEQRKLLSYQFKNSIIFIKQNQINLKAIVSSSSLPKNFSSIEAGKVKKISKLELKLFKKIREVFTDITFIYSDYGISKNIDADIDFSKLKPGTILAKIRYTLDEHYLLLKGRNANKRGHTKIGYKELTKKLTESEDFMGEDFSYGDKKIAALPTDKKRTGSHETLIEYGTNHHIVVILKQLFGYYGI